VKVHFYLLPSGSLGSLEDLVHGYESKISKFVPFEVHILKGKKISDTRASEKALQESSLILEQTKKHQRNILFDENGRTFKDSHDFSEKVVKQLSHNDIAFYIGGAFGIIDEHKKSFSETWSLSPLTTNHHLASVFALEQIYRALTIWKNHPYHND